MRAVLKLERIGDEMHWRARTIGMPVRIPMPWVVRFTGWHGEFGPEREYVRGQRDYTEANRIGSRGVYDYYALRDGEFYEVNEHVTWARWRRYYVRVQDACAQEIDEEELERCLIAKYRSGSMS